MCYGTEAVYIGAALAAAGAATNAYATSQQQKKQDSIAAAGIIKQGEMQKQGERNVMDTTNQVAKSNATTAAKTSEQLQAYRTALQAGSANNKAASPNVPGASKAYKSAQDTAGTGAQSYIDKIAQSGAVTEGTALERVGENQKLGETATQLGILNQKSSEQNYVTQLQVRATQANPWLRGLGTLLSAAGAAYSAGAGFAGAGAGAAGTTAAGGAASFGGTVGAAGVPGAIAGAGFGGAGAATAAAAGGGIFSGAGLGAFGAGAGALAAGGFGAGSQPDYYGSGPDAYKQRPVN